MSFKSSSPKIRRPHLFPLLSILLLLSAFTLLLVSLLTAPNSSSLSIYTLTATVTPSRTKPAGSEINYIRLDLGLLGYCQFTDADVPWYTHPVGCYGSKTGYNIRNVIRGVNNNLRGVSARQTNQWMDLTRGFVLPAVAAACVGIAMLLLILGEWVQYLHRIKSFLNITAWVFTFLGMVFSVAGMGCVISLIQKIKKTTWSSNGMVSIWTNMKTTEGIRYTYQYRLRQWYGAGTWTLVVACALLVLAVGVLGFTVVKERRATRKKNLRVEGKA
ncbi:hypothetical protein QBC38DRAFT_467611 [Podospora fimiseda]|uniref:Uncharacterized protein n=1 Tax=Podospora fimiseda TaxID=252190 RepID=A0AAN7BWU3_9PEZI|nr:hypothetical protein QBC38DRAFT_467611 [Podospora fimiseda]